MHVSDEDGVRTVTFDRPDSRNAMTREIASDLADRIEDVSHETFDALVLTGEGEAFCAGGDIESMAEREMSTREAYEEVRATFGRVVEAALTADVPIVAKVNGDAVGAGLALAAVSDFAYGVESASFGCAFVHVGLIPDTGGTFLLPQLIGLRAAKQLAFTGETFSADAAAELGLINESVADDAIDGVVEELLSTLANRPTQTIGLTKQALHENAGRHWREALDYENHLQAQAYDTPAHEEGVDAFLEGRPPEFD
ncbi:enoyl-CoA hydratase-related protein [Halostella sp. PRR32]|uniref:enoyl-CoA hydratase/isomerase family protein n=1 Tax=Halostella sp. PRR32 TaxID=3098147 RepID=UPI002B1D9F62|nr:enoyl-CoA hydratase-related protein [Halostella sp. PRR32]